MNYEIKLLTLLLDKSVNTTDLSEETRRLNHYCAYWYSQYMKSGDEYYLEKARNASKDVVYFDDLANGETYGEDMINSMNVGEFPWPDNGQ